MLYPEVKWPGREADYSPPSGADVKNEWNCTSLPTIPSYSVEGNYLFTLVKLCGGAVG
jgi:hypothetical protein